MFVHLIHVGFIGKILHFYVRYCPFRFVAYIKEFLLTVASYLCYQTGRKLLYQYVVVAYSSIVITPCLLKIVLNF